MNSEAQEAEMHKVDFAQAMAGNFELVGEFDEDFDKQFLSGNGGGIIPTDEPTVKTNKGRLTYVVSATLGKAFFTSRMMTKKVKTDLKKIMKDNPDTVPNMKLNEIMKHISFKNKTKVVDLTTDVLLPAALEMMKVDVMKDDKMLYLYYFVDLYKDKTMVIFTNSISSSNRIKHLLDIAGKP